MPAVAVDALCKDYGALRAVDNLSFTIAEGEIFALLGPNGAGKTTTIEILEGHRSRSSGTVSVLGFDPQSAGQAFRARIGIVLQEAGFEEDFTPRELVSLHRRMYPRRLEVDDVLELVGLQEKANARVRTLSGGQRRRLDLALGLVGDPDLLFLDEPTTGFDPSARRKAWELVDALRGLGKTVLLTTHYMDEAEHLADRVAVIVGGRLVALGTPGEIGAGSQPTSIISFRLPDDFAFEDLPRLEGELTRSGSDLELVTSCATASLHELTSWAIERSVELPSLSIGRPSLEDAYLALVGHEDAAGRAAEGAS